ncbi:DUF3014 domain-containing protein [Arenimonas fontis]|uniref:DUF3014 domain-containing protein n=1 Tax=Arenimonas fontis TaxID=2608255 RepID=A0A5B2ZDB3_9GAMM|nr:DUF3014 domain-containing protein [Arenimonas fontis]KAA2285052.1 DUF3014 domain-containing protein [Arenimonas fontis]
MSRRFHYGPWLAVAVLALSGFLVWKYYPRQAPAELVVPGPEPVATVEQAPPPVQHPIGQVPVLPEDAPAEPLPALADSDGAALAALSELLGEDAGAFLRSEFLVQRLVATIDNLPRARMTPQAYVARPVAGRLAVAGADGRHWLDEANFTRYQAHVRLLEAVEPRALVSVYVRFYPLFQQAYRELGVPDRQFNDRLVEVLDHLIAAPELRGPVELVPAEGKPRWQFADPRMEAASLGHKLMWRIGPDNAARVKARLRTLRALLAGEDPQG